MNSICRWSACSIRRCRQLLSAVLWISACLSAAQAVADDGEAHFEKHIRPLLIERCHKCHSGTAPKGGLRLDSREAILTGGDSGAAIFVGEPDESLLMQAVRHQNGLEMPPDGKLDASQIAALERWIETGAVWAGAPVTSPPPSVETVASVLSMRPDQGDLASSLRLWLRADALTLDDGEPVYVWPDQSGHGRDVSATRGVRTGGVGLPGRFVKHSSLRERPAVRFETTTGFASSPQNRIDIRGDAALTIVLVINLERHDAQPPYDGILGMGNPAHPTDPGKPLAALVQINRNEDHALNFAGGWNHDASLGAGSFQPRYGKPTVITIVKTPGPMRTTTQIYLDGIKATGPNGELLAGSDALPDIQHRDDIGVYLGKALDWCGSIQGDIGEVLVYNTAVSEAQRLAIEGHLAEKYGLWLDPAHNIAVPAEFTAAERNFWAFQPVQDGEPPAVEDESWIRSPVDRFILASLEAKGVAPALTADKLSLLRRVTFDLTGLPPTPEEVAAFFGDDSPDAYERVVNRLLESPHYGERWGRHWLDVVRYAETTANDANAVMRYAWRYRNYVIDAFNADLPYDQFLIEQLAGDLLEPTDSIAVNTRRIIATGYLMIGTKALAETDKEQSRLDIVDDQIDVTGRAMLGLTLACARCHDHKFDAVRTTDYYALAGIFRSTEPFQNEVRNATMWWEFPIPQGEDAEPIVVMAPKEAEPKNLRVHLRGNRFTLGKIAPRGVLQLIAPTADPLGDAAEAAVDPNQLGSGRLELARWIAGPDNPLTARVMVNRIWQHHFGRGIVATSDNFGERGERPTHPELLDWLAARFVENGWSIKALHRLILLSNAYRQSGTPSLAAPDVESPLYSYFPRRRLSAEEIRDAMLAVSGQLDRTPGTNESGEYLFERAEGIGALIRPNRVAADDPFYTDFKKRSVYLPVVRNILPDVLTLFDFADANGVTAARNETTVASQALFLLNSRFVREQSRAFAERVLSNNEAMSDGERISLAHLLAFGREANDVEITEARDFLSAYVEVQGAQARTKDERRHSAWQSYCQTLLCSNEFLYLE